MTQTTEEVILQLEERLEELRAQRDAAQHERDICKGLAIARLITIRKAYDYIHEYRHGKAKVTLALVKDNTMSWEDEMLGEVKHEADE